MKINLFAGAIVVMVAFVKWPIAFLVFSGVIMLIVGTIMMMGL